MYIHIHKQDVVVRSLSEPDLTSHTPPYPPPPPPPHSVGTRRLSPGHRFIHVDKKKVIQYVCVSLLLQQYLVYNDMCH